MGAATVLLEVPFVFLTLLETGGLFNHQHLMFFLYFYFRGFKHRKKLRECLLHPLHILVHHKALVAWWQ